MRRITKKNSHNTNLLLFLVIIISLTGCKTSIDKLNDSLTRYIKYYQSEDYLGLATMAHPKLIDIYGNTAKLAEHIAQNNIEMGKDDIVILFDTFQVDFSNPYSKKIDHRKIQIPYDVQIQIRGIPQKESGILVAIHDGGKWYIMDAKSRVDLIE